MKKGQPFDMIMALWFCEIVTREWVERNNSGQKYMQSRWHSTKQLNTRYVVDLDEAFAEQQQETYYGQETIMKPKKKTSPKVIPVIPPIVGAIAGVAGRAAARGAAKQVAKNIVKRKATGIKDAKGLSKMQKALSGSKGPKRTTPASKPTSQLERNIGRTSALRRKFPEKYNPPVKKK